MLASGTGQFLVMAPVTFTEIQSLALYKHLYISAYMKNLPARGLGTQLRHLLELLDGGLDKIYQQDGLDYRPRYTPVMRALAATSSATIKEIAKSAGISHSAASQTVSKMVSVGFLEQAVGSDGRERIVRLSTHGRDILPRLQTRWAATQAAADALDAELSHPLSQIATEAIEALTARSFTNRIERQEQHAMETSI